MIRKLMITAIVENTPGTPAVDGEWGLSLWIKADGQHILFDTGQGHSLLQNVQALGIDLSAAKSMVISHGHYDHTGGMSVAVAAGFRGRIFIHPAALEPKFRREETSPARQIGMPSLSYGALRARHIEIVKAPELTEISAGILVTGNIPRCNAYEDHPGPFYLDAACTKPDILVDDQAMLIETRPGWVLITGCGHAGLINLLRYSRELTGCPRIFAVIGGLHLLEASNERIRATIDTLRDCGVELIAPCHCTGAKAIDWFQNILGDIVAPLYAGMTIQVSPPNWRGCGISRGVRICD